VKLKQLQIKMEKVKIKTVLYLLAFIVSLIIEYYLIGLSFFVFFGKKRNIEYSGISYLDYLMIFLVTFVFVLIIIFFYKFIRNAKTK
jgi:hypothetical protein